MKIAILNGPNLQNLQVREPHLYGGKPFEDYLGQLRQIFPKVDFSYQQHQQEGALVQALIALGEEATGLILNAGAYTHTSIALSDTLRSLNKPVVEVHISNVFARETFRHHSYLSAHCAGSITGFGLQGYELATRALLRHVNGQ